MKNTDQDISQLHFTKKKCIHVAGSTMLAGSWGAPVGTEMSGYIVSVILFPFPPSLQLTKGQEWLQKEE